MSVFYKINTAGDVVTHHATSGRLPFSSTSTDAAGANRWMTQLMILLPQKPADPTVIAHLFNAAQAHAVNTFEPEHEVGDLQNLLSAAWSIMTPYQRTVFLRDRAVQDLPDLDEPVLKDITKSTDAAYSQWLIAVQAP